MRRGAGLIGVLLAVLMLTGCWSAREINELAIVLTFGLDLDEDGQYIMTAIIGNPTNPSTAGGDGSSSQGGPGAWIVSEKGDSVFAAVRKMTASIPRRLFWSHAETVVISRRLAESGLSDVMDLLSRDVEPRRSMIPLVTEGEITAVLGAKPIMEHWTSRVLDGLVENQGQHSLSVGFDLNRYYRNRSDGRTASLFGMIKAERDPLGGFGMAPESRIRLSGAAVIWKDRMVGELSEEEARGALLLHSKLKGGVALIPCPGDSEREITIQARSAGGSLSASMKGNAPVGEVKIVAEGDLGEVHCKQLTLTPQLMDKLAGQWEQRSKASVESALTKAKELGVDPFGFGDAIFHSDPRGWRRLSARWPEAFRTMPVRLQVNARLRGTHLTEGVQPAR